MSQSETKRIDDQGVLALGVQSIAHATEKTLRAGFEVVREVRGELSQLALGVIEWIDGAQEGVTRLARSVVQRTDEVATAWIDSNEELGLGILRALRTTSEGATHFASRTAASLTSTRRDKEVVAQA